MRVGNVVGVKVANTSVGNGVHVGGGVSVGGIAEGAGEEQELRRKMQKTEIRILQTIRRDMDGILSHLLR